MEILPNLDFLSVGIAIASTVLLGFTVLFNTPKSITNKTFFAFSVITAIWGFFNLMSYRIPSLEIAFWFLRTEMFFGVWHSFMIFQLFYVFPNERMRFPRWYKTILVPVVAIVSFLTLTPFVFSGIETVSEKGQILTLKEEPGIVLFGVTVFGLTLSSFLILFRKILRVSRQDRRKFLLVLVGVVITFAFILPLNFILPAFFDNPKFVPFGAIFSFPFIAFTSYAILRHKLFNIKVAGTAVLVFLLSVATFSEVILARDIAFIIYRSSIFVLVLSFGTLLIRGVLKEVEQREKLAVLNKKLQAAYDEVDRLSRAKSEFLSMASHQLRTPQTAIKGYLSMVLEGSYGNVPEKVKAVLEKTRYSNERLIDLVNDLLNVSRIESGTLSMDFEKVSLEQIVSFVVDEMRIKADEKKVYLKLEKPATALPKITIDPGKIRQVVLNLIDNALKYTSKGGVTVKIKLKEAAALHPQGSVLVEVKDTGEGLSKEELGNIFESFTRGRAGAKLWIAGLGLGLYIAKKFTELHGGRVWAESEGEGKGSTVFVELPIT